MGRVVRSDRAALAEGWVRSTAGWAGADAAGVLRTAVEWSIG